MPFKTCKKCGKPQPECEYPNRSSYYKLKDGTVKMYTHITNVCNDCRNLRDNEWKKKNNFKPALKDVYYGY